MAEELRNNKNLELYLNVLNEGGLGGGFRNYGIFFGLIALSTALTNSNKVKELEKRINELEGKS